MKKHKATPEEIEFLEQSNAIEGVYDAASLEQAIEAWNYLMSQKVLTLSVVLKTHKVLMLNQRLQPNEKGYFRTITVYIGGKPAINALKIKDEMVSWLLDVKTSVKIPGFKGAHIKADHVEYERIHPFVDGNGRTGRMFYNWQRLKAGLSLEIIYESDRQNYYKWFK